MEEFFWYHLLNAYLMFKRLGTPAKALSLLIRCVDLSEKYNARMVHLGAVSLLCKVMNELDQPQEAYRILTAIMPYVPSEIEIILTTRSSRLKMPIWRHPLI
jgi:hypothetical protein